MTNRNERRAWAKAARLHAKAKASVMLETLPEDLAGGPLNGLSDVGLENYPMPTPLNWLCVDCGTDTAPGVFGKVQVLKEIRDGGRYTWLIHTGCEVYTVLAPVWEMAGSPSGCLCVGCLEKRIGRRLKPKDFQQDDPFAPFPCTPRLESRRWP